jgi:hypothetical protein
MGFVFNGHIGKLVWRVKTLTYVVGFLCIKFIFMKNNKKIIWILFGLSFVVFIFLNSLYGPLLYSKINDREDMYKIGKSCKEDLDSCHEIYFSGYLETISDLQSQKRVYFEKIIIKEDKVEYLGNCPCPYNVDSRWGNCGGRSSYSKGGQISYCYGSDISDDMIEEKKEILINNVTSKLDREVRENINVYKAKATLYILIALYLGIFLYIKYKYKII